MKDMPPKFTSDITKELATGVLLANGNLKSLLLKFKTRFHKGYPFYCELRHVASQMSFIFI